MTDSDWMELLERGRVASLATVRADGRVDLVPCTFAIDDRVLVTAVDHKPKSTLDLKRLENVRLYPEVTLLVEHYDDADWTRLWWVRVRGHAAVHEQGAVWQKAVDLLVARYSQYEQMPPVGPAIVIDRTEITGWKAGG